MVQIHRYLWLSFGVFVLCFVWGGSVNAMDNSLGQNQNAIGRQVISGNTDASVLLTQENTLFVIQDDLILHNKSIKIGANSILEFQGGRLIDGIIDFNNCSFNYDCGYHVFKNCSIHNAAVPYIDIRWFGAVSGVKYDTRKKKYVGEDCSSALLKSLETSYEMNVPVLIAGYYYINKTVEFDGDVSIIGTYMHHGDNKYGGFAQNGGLYVDNVTAIKVRSSQRVRPFSIQHLRVEGSYPFKYGEEENESDRSCFFDYSVVTGPSRPCIISECHLSKLHRAIYLHDDSGNKVSTIAGVLEIRQNSIRECFWALESRVAQGGWGSICQLNLVNNNIESCNGGIHMEKLFGHNSVRNNCFESLFNPIYISWSGELVFDGNYFEDGKIQGLGAVASFEGLESSLVISNNNRQTDNTRHLKVLGKLYDYREYNNSTFTIDFSEIDWLFTEQIKFSSAPFEEDGALKMPFHINSMVGSIGGVTYYLIDKQYPLRESIVWSTNSSFPKKESRYAVFALRYLSSNDGDVSQLIMNSDNDSVLALIRKNRESAFVGKTLMVIMRLKNNSNRNSSFLGVRATGKMLVSEPNIYTNLGKHFGVKMSIE